MSEDRHPGWTDKGHAWLDAGSPTQQQPDGESAGLVEWAGYHHPDCLLAMSAWDQAPFTAQELADQCGCLEKATSHIEALTRRLAQTEAERDAALREFTRLATEAGEAQGRLEMSEAAGIVDGWREKCEGMERALAEADRKLRTAGSALEPFAYEAENYDGYDGAPNYADAPNASSLNEVNDLLVGQLREAREALAELRQAGEA